MSLLVGVHVTILLLTAVAIISSDHEGCQYILGKKKLLDARKMRILHKLVWYGLIGMIISGALLFFPGRAYYFETPAFFLKMFFVVVLIVNAIFIGKLMPIASERAFLDLTLRERMILLVSGATSTVGWVGSAVVGYFFLS